jgi:cysteinyl-tRNA synthetase
MKRMSWVYGFLALSVWLTHNVQISAAAPEARQIVEDATPDHFVFLPMAQKCYLSAPVPTPTPPPPTTDLWNNVENWVYQLSGYPDDQLTQIAGSNFDLAVVDLARDGSSDFFTFDEIQTVKATEKVVLAYFEIGAIENYRPEWADVPADLLLGPVDGWPDEQYVKYWDPRWWTIVVEGRVDQALAAGFDGVYLDMIVTYEEIPADAAGTDRDDLAQKMVDLIAQVSAYAKSQNSNFKVAPQNSPELHTYSGYLTAIDGLGMEVLYILPMDRACTRDWCYENQRNAAVIRAAGKPVFTIDYANLQTNIDSAYTQSLAAGFIPYVSVRDLDVMRINPGWEP